MKKQMAGFLSGILVTLLVSALAVPALAAAAAKTIQVYPGVNFYVDDGRVIPKDAQGNPVEVFIYNGTTYMPLRAVSEAVGKPVQWDGKTRSVYLGKHTGTKPAAWVKDMDYFYRDGNYAWTTLENDKDNLGQVYGNALTSKDSDYKYRINGQYSKLTGTFYQRNEYKSKTAIVTLKIYGDGELLYENTMTGGKDPAPFTIDVSGVLELQIYIESNIYIFEGSAAIGNLGLWT